MSGKIERMYRVKCPVCGCDSLSYCREKQDAAREFRNRRWVIRKGLWIHKDCESGLAGHLERIAAIRRSYEQGN